MGSNLSAIKEIAPDQRKGGQKANITLAMQSRLASAKGGSFTSRPFYILAYYL